MSCMMLKMSILPDFNVIVWLYYNKFGKKLKKDNIKKVKKKVKELQMRIAKAVREERWRLGRLLIEAVF